MHCSNAPFRPSIKQNTFPDDSQHQSLPIFDRSFPTHTKNLEKQLIAVTSKEYKWFFANIINDKFTFISMQSYCDCSLAPNYWITIVSVNALVLIKQSTIARLNYGMHRKTQVQLIIK